MKVTDVLRMLAEECGYEEANENFYHCPQKGYISFLKPNDMQLTDLLESNQSHKALSWKEMDHMILVRSFWVGKDYVDYVNRDDDENRINLHDPDSLDRIKEIFNGTHRPSRR